MVTITGGKLDVNQIVALLLVHLRISQRASLKDGQNIGLENYQIQNSLLEISNGST